MPNNTITPTTGSPITFIYLEGAPADARQQVEVMTRPGVDGVASRLLGEHPPEEQPVFTGIVDVNAVNLVAAKRQEIYALEGQMATVTDVHGIVETNVLIQRVWQDGPVQRHASAIGGVMSGLNRWVMTFRFVMVFTNV